jgi:hypothetical protein
MLLMPVRGQKVAETARLAAAAGALSRDVHPRLFLKIKQSFMDTH